MNTSLQYAITGSRGARASTSVQITVDPNVPLERPIARDDRVRADVKDGTTGRCGGARERRRSRRHEERSHGDPRCGRENARVGADGTVRVQVTDQRQLITYTVTDPTASDSPSSVPALSELPPSLISTKPVEVKSGETISSAVAVRARPEARAS
jgi:hypothetical protein